MLKFVKKYGVLIWIYVTLFLGIVMLNARFRYLNEQTIQMDKNVHCYTEMGCINP